MSDAPHSVRPPLPDPPGTWSPARNFAKKALAPVERFLHVEASSGVLLLIVAVLALLWANSPWQPAYEALWHTPIGLRFGGFAFERDLHFWINDGLMTIFFFVVGLEIRREIHRGELSELRRAALPLAAALGGMLVPAAIYSALNWGRPTAGGWGVPMATDIAFAVGVLALLGKRIPPAVRVLLLALAVIDDVGAILVIAFFYSSGFKLAGFIALALGLVLTVGMQKVGVRSPWAYVAPAIIVWAGAYAGGVHPTLAGVLIGMMTPVRAWFGAEIFLERAEANVQTLREKRLLAEQELLPHLDALNWARREAVSPVERLQHVLHGWVAYGVMPLFALANAGVPLGNAELSGDSVRVFAGISLGLLLGKLFGVLGFAWLAHRLGLATLPIGIGWSHVGLMGAVAGIGFTMALFIAQLAFPAGVMLETAKLAILAASAAAAIGSFIWGKFLLGESTTSSGALSEAEAEASTAR